MQRTQLLYAFPLACALTAGSVPALAEPTKAQGAEHKAGAAHAHQNVNAAKPKTDSAAVQTKTATTATAATPKADEPVSKIEMLAKARKALMASIRQNEAALAKAARLTLAAKQKLQQRARNPKAVPTEIADLSKEVIVKHDDTVAQVSVLEGASQQLESTETELAQLVTEAETLAATAKTNADATMLRARELAAAEREARKNLMRVRALAGLGTENAMKARKEKLTRDREAWKKKRTESDALLHEAQSVTIAPKPDAAPAPKPAVTTGKPDAASAPKPPTPAAAKPASAATPKPAK